MLSILLIRVHYTGICRTDVYFYQWDEWARKTIPVPMAIGHEFLGEIVKVGSNVNDFYPGDIVSGEGHVPTCERVSQLPGWQASSLCAYPWRWR